MRASTWVYRWVAALAIFGAVIVPLLQVQPAKAFKPYTHTKIGDQAYEDVVADGKVTIDGVDYSVPTEVYEALRDYPQFYRGGTIGPDGFPDIVYGQGVIHPATTGEWMRYVYDQAWAAQTNTTAYPTLAEGRQILAFAYGYLTHAAGDMWAHTFVNEFAEGVFPAVGEVLTEVDKAAIALRHIIVEGYLGDATAGFDGNSDQGSIGED